MTSVDDIQNAARARLRGANQMLAQAEDELREAIAEGLEAKLTKVEVAKLSGISRPTIDKWMNP